MNISLFIAERSAGVNGGGGDVEKGFQLDKLRFDNGIRTLLFQLVYYYRQLYIDNVAFSKKLMLKLGKFKIKPIILIKMVDIIFWVNYY